MAVDALASVTGAGGRSPAVSKIKSLDTTIFAIQPGHHPDSDRISFLRIQRLVRNLQPGYTYLEVGSDIGGSLLPHLSDPNCAAAISIDPRPQRTPDERGIDFHYDGVSTACMLDELGKHLSPNELGKLSTIEADASAISRSQFSSRPHLVFIDGEHTNTAAFSDFLAVLPLIADTALVTFHDANLVGDAIQNIERLLVHLATPHSLLILPSCVAVFGFGDFIAPMQTELARYGEERSAYFDAARVQRHQAVANAVIERTDGLRAHSIAELVAWTARTEQMLTAEEVPLRPTPTRSGRKLLDFSVLWMGRTRPSRTTATHGRTDRFDLVEAHCTDARCGAGAQAAAPTIGSDPIARLNCL